MINSVLIDARTPAEVLDRARQEISTATLLGLDCETQDEARHAGLNAYNNKKRHVFDHRRTTMTGFSFYSDGSDTAWYVNLAHADVENRLNRQAALDLLAAHNPNAIVLAHNAPFELVMFEQCLGVKLENILCTLQLAVSHHGPDEYEMQRFFSEPLTAFKRLAKDVMVAFANYDGESRGRNLNGDQAELLGKFIAKESKSEHSYNGFVKSIATGYSLKRLTESRFGVKQTTYEEVLKAAGATHMGELTGEQVCAYGADDAYWAVQHFKWLRDDLLAHNPQAFVTFLQTENPMVQVYAEAWRDGLRLNLEQVYERQAVERVEMAKVLRKTKALIRELLPFPAELNAQLLERQDWYRKHAAKKRAEIVAWANSRDVDDDFEQCFQVSNPIGNAWAIERGLPAPKGKLNITHYYCMRTLLHDLMGHKLVFVEGEVSTDKDARGKMMLTFEREDKQTHIAILKALQEMAEIEQRMKLYLTPYTQLMDPETSRVYPSLSSQLATRRLAASFPNPMQLAKQGSSTYIRGFYLGDTDDHVVVSADWSAIELVLIGELSGDPAFAEVYGQLPYGDLHTGAAADCLAVKTLPGLTEAEFREFKFNRNPNNRVLKHISTGIEIEPAAFFKLTRGTPVGKGANFSYWYSGALSTVGQTLGWSPDEMWEAVDRYRQRFAIAEKWRVGVGDEVVERGFITLPDGHRRVRAEATSAWATTMLRKFADISSQGSMMAYADLAIRRIQGRARNQAVNAMIQGTCAALAKRSILRLRQLVDEADIADRVRFMIPIHDELVFSVHQSVVTTFIPLLRQAMCEHPEIVKSLPLNCSVAVGRTFRPFDKTNPAFSQIELDEVLGSIDGVIGPEWEGKKLPDDKVAEVIDFISKAKVAA